MSKGSQIKQKKGDRIAKIDNILDIGGQKQNLWSTWLNY